MAKKIIVAGAGHGGIMAGAILAENGFDVTIYERKIQSELGYDWLDAIDLKIFSECSLPIPEEGTYGFNGDMKFFNPNLKTPLTVESANGGSAKFERKYIYKVLIENAEKKGVKFIFNTEIIEPIMDGLRVVGILTSDGEVYGDLIIDAAGINSPIRKNLPVCCNIDRDYGYGECFYAYRAYFDKLPAPKLDVKYEVFLMPFGDQGISWVVTEDDCVDVLIGKMMPLSKKEIEAELQKMREFSPQIGHKVLRGGSIGQIPVRRPLDVMVCDGYAAIGDSAYMTFPMTGSGICPAMRAALLLAETVLEDKECKFSAKTLWSYNKKYIIHFGQSFASIDILKNTLLGTNVDGVNFLFDKQIITQNDMHFGKGAGGNVAFSDMVSRAVKGIGNLPVLLRTAGALSKGDSAKKAYREIPDEYNVKEILKWKESILSETVFLQRQTKHRESEPDKLKED